MSYVVTGCAGFIGSHLCESLVGRGYEVVGIDNLTDYYPRRLKIRNLAWLERQPRFYWLRTDLIDDEGLLGEISRSDGVFHLAAQPGVRDSWKTFSLYTERNLLATERVFSACLEAKKKVVYASSSSVYGNANYYPVRESDALKPISPYGVTKLACEALAYAYRMQGLEAVGLRYFTVYGPRQRPDMAFARIIKALQGEEKFWLFGNGLQTRDFTFIEDAVRATIAVMDKSPQPVYNVGGGEEATLIEAIMILEEHSGLKLPSQMTSARRAGDVRRTKASYGLIRGDIGWEPLITLEKGLKLQWEASKNE